MTLFLWDKSWLQQTELGPMKLQCKLLIIKLNQQKIDYQQIMFCQKITSTFSFFFFKNCLININMCSRGFFLRSLEYVILHAGPRGYVMTLKNRWIVFLTGSLKQAIWKNPSLHYEQEMDMPQEEWLLTTPSGVVYKDQIALLHIFERDYFILLKQNVKLDIHVFHLKLCHDGQQLKSAVMAHYKKCSLWMATMVTKTAGAGYKKHQGSP